MTLECMLNDRRWEASPAAVAFDGPIGFGLFLYVDCSDLPAVSSLVPMKSSPLAVLERNPQGRLLQITFFVKRALVRPGSHTTDSGDVQLGVMWPEPGAIAMTDDMWHGSSVLVEAVTETDAQITIDARYGGMPRMEFRGRVSAPIHPNVR
jgi:hypothetical protein